MASTSDDSLTPFALHAATAVLHILKSSFSVISSITSITISLIAPPFRSSSSILLYFIAPVTILAYIAYEYFVQLPYRFLIAAFDTFYPLYTFIGASLIVAGLTGFFAKWITVHIQEALERPPSSTAAVPHAPSRPPAYTK